ncbi:hypothetical protein C8R47DRAFT_1206199 [Mycena vitilis]|nr:hypothetical protein C8R47DRAFT_1206199 [Mycena vitilis]
MSDRRTRCPPLYYPSPGQENTFVVDHDPDGRYYLVGKGRAVGIFTDANRANEQTDGFSGYVKKKAKRWAGYGGARELWDVICDEYHRNGCPPPVLPQGFAAPTPVNRDPPPTPPANPPPPPNPPSPSTFSPPPPRTPRRSNEDEVRSSVSPSPMRTPRASTMSASASSIPAGPPPPYHHHRLSPVFSSRPRPRATPAPSTPSPATPAPSQNRAAVTPAVARVPPSTPSNTGDSNTGDLSDEDGSDIELVSEMWAIEGLPGKFFLPKDLAFANSNASYIRNPRYASGNDVRALDLFSRGLL